MSLHWTLIAGFLYTEIVVVLLLLIPLVSCRTWNKLFKSRFLKGLENQLIYYFYVLVAILVLFFLGEKSFKIFFS
jgi:B-cell receptor-associated protein 31